MNGTVYGRGLAHAYDCAPVPYTILAPGRDVDTIGALAKGLDQWRQVADHFGAYAAAGTLTQDVVARATFATNVLMTVGENVLVGVCCNLLAVDPDDRILAAMTYFILPPDQGAIGLLAVDPRNVPGSPFVVQYRGVGTAMLAAAIQRMLEAGVASVALHPLDPAAKRFWMARGFVECGGAHLLCVKGRAAMQGLIDGCLLTPDNPSEGQIVLCGLPKQVREKLLLAGKR